MRIIDEPLLKSFRRTGCEWCRKNRQTAGHHLWSRGAGRLDISINLAALCDYCHADYHNGKIARFDLLAIVAVREKVNQHDIEAVVHFLRRLPKRPTVVEIEAAMDGMEACAIGLARRILG